MEKNIIIAHSHNKQIVTLTLNRIDKHNALDDAFIQQLLGIFKQIDADAHTSVVIVQAAGKTFCAGADLAWMQRMAHYSLEENRADALQLAALFARFNQLSKPTVVLVQGPVYGGGIGLVACADTVIAAKNAAFCFSETNMGLLPATIAPYVLAKI